MVENNYCPKCGKFEKLVVIKSYLPGLTFRKCIDCNTFYTVNYLESGEDMLECPNNFIILKD